MKNIHNSSYKQLLTLVCAVFCLGITSLNAQKILLTESGQKILIASDGSWSIVKFDEKIDIQGNIVSETSTSLDAFQAPNAGKYPLTVEQESTVNNVLKSLLSDEAQLLVNAEFFKANIVTLKEKKRLAKKEKNESLEKEIAGQIKFTEASATNSKQAYKESSNLIADANDLLNGKVKKRESHIAKLIQKTELSHNLNSGMGGTVAKEDKAPQNENPSKTTIENDIESAAPITISKTSYPTSFNVIKDSAIKDNYDCQITFDGYDKVLRSDKKEVKSEFFFGHSQKKMKSYFKNDDFIKCDAFVSKVGKKRYITLKLRVKSKNAKKTYGMIRANETMRFEMIDGSKIYCTSMIQDEGTIEAYTGNTLYTGIFEIEKDDIDILKDNFLDNIGIIWSSGYEQYNILNVDFLKNQLRCLEK